MVEEEDVAETVVTGPDPEPYFEEIREYVDDGFDRVYLHQTGAKQREFVEFAEREILPEFEGSAMLSVPDSVELSREFFVALGAPGLFAVAFLEFFLSPVPPDFVLIPLAVAQPELAFLDAAIATAGSVTAGLVGFAIGKKGGRPALESRFSDERTARAEGYVERHGLATLTIGAFAPIPEGYELRSIAAGVFGMDLRTYVVASLAGRGGTYFLEVLLVVAIGEAARTLTEPQLYGVIAVVTLVVVAADLSRRYWLSKRWRTLDG